MTVAPDPAASTPAPLISRRNLIRAGLAWGATLALAACAVPERTVVTSSPSPGSSAATSAPSAPGTSPAATPSTRPTVTPATEPPLREMVAGLLVVGFRGLRLADAPWLRTALARGLGGVVLFDHDQITGGTRNVASPAQVALLTREIHATAAHRPLVAVDQEGGVVTRLSPAHGFAPLASEAAVGRETPAAARAWAAGMAATLAAAGIDLDFAPVVDLDVNPASPAIGALGRSFSADPSVVVARASTEIRALRARGIRTTLKHFPGLGSSTANTDFGVADVTATWTEGELAPFRTLIAAGLADVVMVGHVVDRHLDPAYPASLSTRVVGGLLRGSLGWGGPVVTDDLQAAAITRTFGRADAIVRALVAGDDLLLLANQQVYEPDVVEASVDAVVAAVDAGRLPAARVREAWMRVRGLASP